MIDTKPPDVNLPAQNRIALPAVQGGLLACATQKHKRPNAFREIDDAFNRFHRYLQNQHWDPYWVRLTITRRLTCTWSGLIHSPLRLLILP